MRIILASKSPRRQFLVKSLGLKPVIRTRDVDESFPKNLKGKQIALYLCRKKAEAFRKDIRPSELLITADTIVWIGGKVLNKPSGPKEAVSMLSRLSGKTHEVFTGVCLSWLDKKNHFRQKSFSVRSSVKFRRMSREEILYYVKHYKPFDKAGAYGAQEGLPDGKNPCSKSERRLLKRIGKPDLYREGRYGKKNAQPVHIVEKIGGSYFNVMGLPVVELQQNMPRFSTLE